jgi:hypothetical protein
MYCRLRLRPRWRPCWCRSPAQPATPKAISAARLEWRRISRTRGIAGLIGDATDRPSPLGIGIVEELIARTSPRRIVDDPGSASFPNPAVSRQHWQNLTGLSGNARSELLMRLFGHVAEAVVA